MPNGTKISDVYSLVFLPSGGAGATNFEMLSVGSEVIVVMAGRAGELRHISQTVPSPYRTCQCIGYHCAIVH